MNKKAKKKSVLALAVIVVTALIISILLINSSNKEKVSMFGQIESEEAESIQLEHNLEITEIGTYTGTFVEDGSDVQIADIMSIVVKNNDEKDLQYAEIYLQYEDYQAAFEISNLKAGASAVLLEQNRYGRSEKELDAAIIENVVFYEESMSLAEDVLEIEGLVGTLNIKNISDKDITGDIYIYYKNCENGLYYGGITYRVRVKGGIQQNQIYQVVTQHYSPEKCEIIMADIVEKVE